MIELFYADTPNGKKITIMLEEIKHPYKITLLDLKKGDRVLFGKYSGTEVKVGGDEYLVMREDDIMCVVE